MSERLVRLSPLTLHRFIGDKTMPLNNRRSQMKAEQVARPPIARSSVLPQIRPRAADRNLGGTPPSTDKRRSETIYFAV